jgi:NitT/TauT family transport system substrate-binding protein
MIGDHMNGEYRGVSKLLLGMIVMAFVLSLLTASGQRERAQKVDKIVLSTPFSPLAMPMAYILENNLLEEYADSVELVVWNNPDQLRAQMSGDDVDFVSIPSNTASIFYNKGVNLKMLKVSIWRVFYIVSEDTTVRGIEDLRGKKVLIPFRGDQPDLVFQSVCQRAGLDPMKDLEIQYVPSPQDIVMNLVGGKADYGLMIEPVATIASMRGAEKGKKITRVVDLQEEWGRLLNLEPRFPNAGVAAMPIILEYPEIVDTFAEIYDQAVEWSTAHPKEAGLLAAKYVKGVPAPAFAKALEYTTFESHSSAVVKKELETMFTEFLDLNPASIGGKLPDDALYYK